MEALKVIVVLVTMTARGAFSKKRETQVCTRPHKLRSKIRESNIVDKIPIKVSKACSEAEQALFLVGTERIVLF